VSAPALETVELEPRARADATVLWMHGLGADGHDFEALVPELRLPEAPAVRFVFPHAPIRPVTINGGHRMRAWYDVTGFDRSAPQDEAGIRESAESLGALVRRERERGIPSDRIVAAGFSQGGAMALQLGLRWPERLAGILALSTWLPLADTLETEAHPANAAVPVLMAHGSNDPVIPIAMGQGSRDALRARGYDVDWRSYPMPHSVCVEEVQDIRHWLLQTLPKLA
jgi:phospholipase/carboxylesterase